MRRPCVTGPPHFFTVYPKLFTTRLYFALGLLLMRPFFSSLLAFRQVFLFLAVWGAAILAQAQSVKYWVYLKDKPVNERPVKESYVSAETRENRIVWGLPEFQETDVPVNLRYISIIRQKVIRVYTASKWLNAVSIEAHLDSLTAIKELPFVLAVKPIRSFLIPAEKNGVNAKFQATALRQVEGLFFKKEGLTGFNVKVGVIDAGFKDADRRDALGHLFRREKIKVWRDFVNPAHTENFFRATDGKLDTHGSTVLQFIAGNDSEKGMQYGCATNANFYLARTDDYHSERRVEEQYWLAAMEWMDSSAIKLINTSLGYGIGFDLPEENHSIEELDGQTSIVSQAVNIATDQKGILVVVSAGNEGADPNWATISTPADAPNCLSIGATLDDPWPKANFSGFSLPSQPNLKPDLACFGPNGTSFSAPIVTGMAACLMQKFRSATNKEIMDMLKKSGNLAGDPNNYLGFGIPNAKRAYEIGEGDKVEVPVERIYLDKSGPKLNRYEVSSSSKNGIAAVAFHKKDAKTVLTQEVVFRGNQNTFGIERPSEATQQTTLMLHNKVIVIYWN